jgi:uncharacterized protein YwgA
MSSASDNASRLFASLAALGINPKMETFGERKRVQKTVYLLDNVFGMGFNYNYSWYLHGPYCPSVTQIIFDVVERRRCVDANPNHLSNEDLCRIERMKSFLGEDLFSNDALELLVSVDYLLSCTRKSDSQDREITEFLNVKKPYFTDDQIAIAIQRMKTIRSH